MGYGTLVSEVVKGTVLGGLRSAVRSDLAIHSPLLRSELGSFVEKENGKLEAESGCMDDRVMAMAHAVAAVERAAIMTAPKSSSRASRATPDQFSWEAIFGDSAAGGSLPFTEGKWG
jgi:hypothetical protein